MYGFNVAAGNQVNEGRSRFAEDHPPDSDARLLSLQSNQRSGFDDSLTDIPGNHDGFVSDPSSNAAIFKHVDDMTFIEVPHGNSTKSEFKERTKRNAVPYRGALWPEGRIPYLISSSFSERQRDVILSAIRHWEDNTCIRFHPRTTEHHHIYIMFGSGCHSYVGRVHSYYQPQGISLGPGCIYFSTAVHEIGHAIGFFHEHTRYDRDEYVEVLSDNIRNGSEENFRKFSKDEADTLGYGYDYASIMHYSKGAFSTSYNKDSIRARTPNIVFGNAHELSPLDILKGNRLYGCVPGRHPPISTILPEVIPLSVPQGMSCGGVFEGKSGTFMSPNYPNHLDNQRCAWVVRIPDGYYFQIDYPGLQMDESSDCSQDYVQLFYGTSFDTNQAIHINDRARHGKICNRQQMYYKPISVYGTDTITIYYHTDDRNNGTSAMGLRVDFTIKDVNECKRANGCHRCLNIPGSYQCDCNDGYYHSQAANTCYDVNECAYDNGGCDHHCINSGGSFSCECKDGFYLQSDGVSCSKSPLDITPPLTTKPTLSPTTLPPLCGGTLTALSGVIVTPNWPRTYPLNFDCEWTIQLPDSNSIIQLIFHRRFGIAGNYVDSCPKDYLKVYDGLKNGASSFKTICDLTAPAPITTTSNEARLVFHAGPSHGYKRVGFRISYHFASKPTTTPTTLPPATRPTTIPPTTRPTTRPTSFPITPSPFCGGTLTALSGVIATPNWPVTYPLNFNCEWTIQLPDFNSIIQLTFHRRFGIAGNYAANCPKDYLRVYDGLESGASSFDTICDLTAPAPIRTTSNKARLVFHAGPSHGYKRVGFKVLYHFVSKPTSPPPTIRPTIISPTTSPTTISPPLSCPIVPGNPQGEFECGGLFTPSSSTLFFGPRTFPKGPISSHLDCYWRMMGSADMQFQVKFTYFDIPYSKDCADNFIAIYDGLETSSPLIKRMCGVRCDEHILQGSTNTTGTLLVRMVINSPALFRGFHAHFEEF